MKLVESTSAARARRGLPVELVVVWTLFALVAVEIFVTYARLPARELYHVTGTGVRGGASRALVFTNFPTALVAIGVAAVLFDRLTGRVARAGAVVAVVLSAAVFWPGVVDQADLDAKWVNAVAAAGVALALVLSLAHARAHGVSGWGRRPFDVARLLIGAALVLVSLAWFAADLGFFLDGVPVLGHVFETGRRVHEAPGLPPLLPAVHHGHHHGMDGLLLVVSSFLLSRRVDEMVDRRLRTAVTAYLALMFCYGFANLANDFWLEQIVKRGWTTWQIPSVLVPEITAAWGVIVLGTVLIWLAAFARDRRLHAVGGMG